MKIFPGPPWLYLRLPLTSCPLFLAAPSAFLHVGASPSFSQGHTYPVPPTGKALLTLPQALLPPAFESGSRCFHICSECQLLHYAPLAFSHPHWNSRNLLSWCHVQGAQMQGQQNPQGPALGPAVGVDLSLFTHMLPCGLRYNEHPPICQQGLVVQANHGTTGSSSQLSATDATSSKQCIVPYLPVLDLHVHLHFTFSLWWKVFSIDFVVACNKECCTNNY